MSMQVLKTRSQIPSARRELVNMGASSLEPSLRALLRRLGLAGGVPLGDHVKSWDVLATLTFVKDHVQTIEPILDIGCYASELIVALHKLGYTDLTGADLNPDLRRMPYSNLIRYENVDFMHTTFADESFRAITATSVIEHGFDGRRLLTEMGRLLKPDGFFIASFDYWPEKIDTAGIEFFGMDWKIFSIEEIASFIDQAATHGLKPIGDLDFAVQDPVIECGGKKYTFGWLVLKKAG